MEHVSQQWESALSHLLRVEPSLGAVFERFPGERILNNGTAFEVLSHAIVGQQISVKAAASIFGRAAAVVGEWKPASVVGASPEALRGAGLSARKVEYLQGIAQAFHSGTVNPEAWEMMSDEAVLKDLISLRGIGRWTAEMFLIFHLQRPDVLPLDDVGLLQSAAKHFGWEYPFPAERLRERAEAWKPWRSVATWYLWRALDAEPVKTP